jgi:hypothetical protein
MTAGACSTFDVRVGDEKPDSGHTYCAADATVRWLVAPRALPLDADADAIRAVAWHQTDKQYKAAVERFLQVKTQQRVKAPGRRQVQRFLARAAR